MTTRRDFLSALLNEEISKDQHDDIEAITLKYILWFPVITTLSLLFFGLTKGVLGCCIMKIDKWNFNNVQSFKTYEEAGRCCKIFINSIIFILLPISFCSHCCTLKNTLNDSKFNKNQFYDSESEDDRLLNFTSPYTSSIFERNNYSSETLLDIGKKSWKPLDKKEEEILVRDTEFIVGAMNESHESLIKFTDENKNIEKYEAKELINNLLAARIVYRKFSEPIGGVKVKNGQSYSIRGYFLPSRENGYQFVTYSPLKQVYEISKESMLVPLAPCILLDAKVFRQHYRNKHEVYNAGDLSLQPSLSSPCINIVVQERSMYLK